MRRVLKFKKKLDEARKQLKHRLSSFSVDELRKVLDANTVEALIEGRLRVPESTLARSLSRALKDRFAEIDVVLDEGSLEVKGRYKKLGVEIDFYFLGTDLDFVAEPPPGVLTLYVDGLDVGAGGGVPIQQILSLIILSVLRFIYGERLVKERIDEVEGVTLTDDMLVFKLAEIPQVREVIDRSIFGVRLGDLVQVTDIKFVPGSVEVTLSVSEALERAAALLDPMRRPGG